MPDFLASALSFVLNLDKNLDLLVQGYGTWAYVILFLIIFAETGLVVFPFLPGDSLLFAAGALAARPDSLNVWLLWLLLTGAAVLGDGVNYAIGKRFGGAAGRRGRFIKPEHLERTHGFYDKYGGKTIVVARFVPIVRTFAPFVAGMGEMEYRRFLMFNVGGALLWVTLLLLGGYFFGTLPWVQDNFGVVVIAIIVISLLPAVIEFISHKRGGRGPHPLDGPAGQGEAS